MLWEKMLMEGKCTAHELAERYEAKKRRNCVDIIYEQVLLKLDNAPCHYTSIHFQTTIMHAFLFDLI